MPFEIKDRVAVGDNKYIIEELDDGRVMLTPAPDSVEEEGTPLNKEVLQPLVDSLPIIYRLFWDTGTNEITNGDEIAFSLYNDLLSGRNIEIQVDNGTYNHIAIITDRNMGFFSVWSPRFQKIYSWRCGDGYIAFWKEHFISDDVIIEQGTSGIWTYRKWASGIAECWGKVDTVIGAQIEYGNVFVSPEVTALKEAMFPIEFVEVPNVTLGLETRDISGAIITGETHSKERIGSFYIVSFVPSGSNKNITLHAQVKGKWK